MESAKWYLGVHMGTWWKIKYPHIITREALWQIAFWCVSSSHRVPPFPSWNSLLTLLSSIRQSDIWEPIGAHGEKGSILTWKLQRIFLRNCFLMWHFIIQSSTIPFLEQFANTVVVDSAKWYLGAHRGPWWKRKYSHIITREKLSERLLSDVWLHHTEFHPSLLGTVC